MSRGILNWRHYGLVVMLVTISTSGLASDFTLLEASGLDSVRGPMTTSGTIVAGRNSEILVSADVGAGRGHVTITLSDGGGARLVSVGGEAASLVLRVPSGPILQTGDTVYEVGSEPTTDGEGTRTVTVVGSPQSGAVTVAGGNPGSGPVPPAETKLLDGHGSYTVEFVVSLCTGTCTPDV